MIAQEVIYRALRIAGVIASGETPQASDVSDALDTLNALLAEWHEAQVGIPDYSLGSEFVTMTTDVADRDAMAYQLAFRMAPEYGFEPTPSQMQAASEAWGRLALRYFQPGRVDPALPSTRTDFDIEHG